jgi:vacuolar-type H+-ATPase subunit I/STV1
MWKVIGLCSVWYYGPFFMFSIRREWQWVRLCDVVSFCGYLMVVSVLVGSRHMSVAILDGFWIRNRAKKFICPLSSCVGLNFMSLSLVHTGGNTVRAYLFGILYNQNVIYVMYVECYIFGIEEMFYMFILKVLQEYFSNCAQDWFILYHITMHGAKNIIHSAVQKF